MRSFTRPPRSMTTECSCKGWPIPGMYAVTSMPFVRRTRAILRSAELGFLGVVVVTLVQTPRLNGELWKTALFFFVLKLLPSATERDFLRGVLRGRLVS